MIESPRPGGGPRDGSPLLSVATAAHADLDVLDNTLGGTGTPTGTVTFSSNSTGAFDAPSCTLAAGACTLGYTPAVSGNHTLTATYGGDPTYAASSALTGTAVLDADGGTSAFRLACLPTNPAAGTPVTCTATTTVPDLSTSAFVSFQSTGAGTFTPQNACTLVAGSCAVTFTPSAPGSQTVQATLQALPAPIMTAMAALTVSVPPPAGTGSTITPAKVALTAPRTQRVVRRAGSSAGRSGRRAPPPAASCWPGPSGRSS